MSDLFRSAWSYISGNDTAGVTDDFVGTNVEVGKQTLRVKKVIAGGGYGYIYLAQSGNGNEFALKRLLAFDRKARKAIMNEISHLQQLQGHPNIVKVVCAASQLGGSDAKSVNAYDEYLLLMELCTGGHLVDVINEHYAKQSLTPQIILLIFIQCCKAVAHMHNQSPPIIHRDLKPDNFLLSSNNTVRLCDFGSSTKTTYQPDESWSAQDRATFLQDIEELTTPLYRPPEMLDIWSNQPINEKVDIWDLGCILYILCYGTHPFDDNSTGGSSNLAILNGKLNLTSDKANFERFNELIRKMLTVNVQQRPSVNDVLKDLSDISTDVGINLDINSTWVTAAPWHDHSVQSSAQTDSHAGSNLMSKGTALLGGMLKSVSQSVSNTMHSIQSGKLDATYITSKLIVMPFPVSTRRHESVKGNAVDDVRICLDRDHPEAYHIFNVSPRMYDTTALNNAVTHFCSSTRKVLSLNHLFAVCRAIDSWLTKNCDNIAVIHCKDGKSISVLVTACYLVYCGLFKTGETALKMVTEKRQQDIDFIEVSPSQRRFLRYFSTIVTKGKQDLHEHTVRLENVTLSPVPLFNKARNGCRPYIEVYENNVRRISTLHENLDEMRSFSVSEGKIIFPLGNLVRGDVMITVYHARSTFNAKMQREIQSFPIFQVQLHTSFVEPEAKGYNFSIHKLDCINEENAEKYPSSFLVQLAVCVLKTQQGPTNLDEDDEGDEEPDPILPPDIASIDKRKILFPCFSSKKEFEIIRAKYGKMDTTTYEKLEKLDNSRKETIQRQLSRPKPEHQAVRADERVGQSFEAEQLFDLSTKTATHKSTVKQSSSGEIKEALEAVTPVQGVANTASVVANLLDLGESLPSSTESKQPVIRKNSEDNRSLSRNPEVNVISPVSDFSLINVDQGTKSGLHRSRSVDVITDLVNQSSQLADDALFTFFDTKSPTKAVSSDAFDPFAPVSKSNSKESQKSESAGASTVKLDVFDPFSRNTNQTSCSADDLMSLSPRSGNTSNMFAFSPPEQQPPKRLSQPNIALDSTFFDPFAATTDSHQPYAGEILQPKNSPNTSQPVSKSTESKTQFQPSASKKNASVSNVEQLSKGEFDLNLGQKASTISSQKASTAKTPTQKSPVTSRAATQKFDLNLGQKASTIGSTKTPAPKSPVTSRAATLKSQYVIGSREERGLRNSAGVKPNVAADEFSDLLGAQGFIPKMQDKGPVTINEMRREEVEKTTDPMKLKIQDWVGSQKGNIRALLCSLHTIVWEGCKWQEIGMHQVIETKNVKKYYRKACLCVHPDKLVGEPQEELARAIFVELNEAWTDFEKSGAKPLF